MISETLAAVFLQILVAFFKNGYLRTSYPIGQTFHCHLGVLTNSAMPVPV